MVGLYIVLCHWTSEWIQLSICIIIIYYCCFYLAYDFCIGLFDLIEYSQNVNCWLYFMEIFHARFVTPKFAAFLVCDLSVCAFMCVWEARVRESSQQVDMYAHRHDWSQYCMFFSFLFFRIKHSRHIFHCGLTSWFTLFTLVYGTVMFLLTGLEMFMLFVC